MVLRFNNVAVVDLNHLINLVSMTPIGQSADVIVWRDRQELALKVQIADKDRIIAQGRPSRAPSQSSSIKGLELVTLDVPVARKDGLARGASGAAVMKVEPDSPRLRLTSGRSTWSTRSRVDRSSRPKR